MAEREITAAEAWELRFREEQRTNAVLRAQLAVLRQEACKRELQTLAVAEIARQREYAQALARLGVKAGDDLVERDGKFILVAEAPPASAPGPVGGAGGRG